MNTESGTQTAQPFSQADKVTGKTLLNLLGVHILIASGALLVGIQTQQAIYLV